VFGEVHYATGFLAFQNAGNATAAAQDFSAGVAAYRRLVRDRPEAVAWRFRLAVLLGQGLAPAHQHAGRLEDAWEANGEALDILEILASGDPENHRYAHGLGWEWLRRGHLAQDRQDLDRAVRAYERSAAVQHDLIARTDVTTSAWLDGLATAYQALADIQSQRGDLPAALDAAERALDTRRRIPRPDAEHRFYSTQLAVVEVLVGEARHQAGDLGSARRAVASATETLDRLDAETLDEPMLQVLYVDAVERLGVLRQAIESTPSRSAASSR
ncbi:MAG: tetratricopeptide repeat protein, partial [Acidobacteriota bacterium]